MNKLSFENRFNKFVLDEKLFLSDTKILLALSGGVDSMVLFHLLHRFKVDFSVAHCNFQLRSHESDEDEVFIMKTSGEFAVNSFTKKFETGLFAKSQKISIQEAARNLRYEWFEELILENKFDFIATAHHLDDSIETILFNLCNGCGISGLHGILAKNAENRLIRPLLFATKKEILEYALENRIEFRKDSSNALNKYSRNLIRNEVIPHFKTVNQAFTENFARSIRNFKETEALQKYAINQIKYEISEATQADELLKINLPLIFNFPAPLTVLYEILLPFGFNSSQAEQIIEQAHNSESAEYQSDTHIIIRNYKKLTLFKKSASGNQLQQCITSEDAEVLIDLSKKLVFEKISVESFYAHIQNKSVAFFDADLLKFPLMLRYFKTADTFKPFGMKGKSKKLSNFFKDEKIPHYERTNIPLLFSGSNLIWVVGHRTAIDFAVSNETKNVLKISMVEI